MRSLCARFWLGVACFVSVSQWHPVSVWATTMEAMTLVELSEEASLIVVGVVRARASQYDEFGRIVTDHRIEVQEVWKGAPTTREISMRSLGGEVGDLAMTVPGAPHLSVGQRALFFLRPSTLRGPSPTWLKPLGMSQGVLRIEPVSIQGSGAGPTAPHVMPGGAGLRLLQVRRGGVSTEGASAIAAPTAVHRVRQSVKEIVARQEGTP